MLNVAVAQRYSILVQARNDTSSNWAIHTNMDTTMFDVVPPTLQTSVCLSLVYLYSLLRCTRSDTTSSITYAAGKTITDLSPVQSYSMINDTALVPLVVVPQPEASDTVGLEIVFQTMNDGTNHATLDGYVYNSPIVPAIISALTLGDNATVQEAYGPYSVLLNHLDVVDIVVNNSDTGTHPLYGFTSFRPPLLICVSATYMVTSFRSSTALKTTHRRIPR